MLDIFNTDAFSLVRLTDAINNLKFVPGRIGQLGIFSTTGVNVTSIAIEQKDDVLSLISPKARGGVGQTLDKVNRTVRNLSVPHFPIFDAVMAEEVQGVRSFGTESELETVQMKIAERLAIHNQSLTATEEYARIGAIKGIVTYADGSTLNLFTEFGVTQQTEVDFDLDNASPASGALRKKCAEVARTIATALDGVPFTGMHAFCGDAFFDDLIAHSEVRNTFLQWQAATELRSGYIQGGGTSFGGFSFGGIVWENYRGSVGGTSFIDTNKCHIFPTGVPGLFRTYYAPADYVETVNTIGRRVYARQYLMPNGKGISLEVQMNSLNIATRPRALVQGKRT